MDCENKLGSNLGSWSEEQSDRSSDPVIREEGSDSFGNRRSYGCIFCKRGFTNAQALGGHMNIHRKDRANKSKQMPSFSSSSSSSIPISMQVDQSTFTNTPYFEPLLFRSSLLSYEASASNPHGYFQELGDLNMNLWGSDLSLKIGPSKGRRMTLWNGQGVDLELRLGYDP